jgi:two-component system NtrC family sensor kinase
MATINSIVIVGDDADLTAQLGAAAVRLGYCQPSVLSLAAGAVSAAEDPAADPSLTILALSRGTDDELGLVRIVAGVHPARPIIAVLTPAASGGRVRAGLPPHIPTVEAFDDRALAAAMRASQHAVDVRPLDVRRVQDLQVVNDIAAVVGANLELESVLTGALKRLVLALDASGGSIHLLNVRTGEYEVQAQIGPPAVAAVWDDHPIALVRPTARVIATRLPVVVEDLAAAVPPSLAHRLPVRSSISLPMLVQEQLVGILTMSAVAPYRFEPADEDLLAIIAAQIGAAVQNARLHEVVRRGKHEWEDTFDAISDPIAVFDSSGNLLRGNTALATLLGRAVTELPHSTCHSIGLCGGLFPRCAVGEAVASGTAVRADLTRPGGEIFNVTTFPVLREGAGPSVVQVAKNVTDEIRSARRMRQMSEALASANGRLTATVEQLKSTQAQLLQAEKLSAIGQLVAGVAHELNNPLTSVMGYAQLLEDELLDASFTEAVRSPSELALDLRRIVEEAERAARIVRNLLAFARRQGVERVAHDLGELVARVVALRAYDLRLNDVTLETSYQPNLPPILADAGQIQQAVLNLILNAEQAMRGRPGRRITLTVRLDEAASAVEFEVADTGHGIDTQNLPRIFDPFFTTRDVGDGTGLGLSICYGIVREHGGQIDVESRVGEGTTFSVLLPACAAVRQPAAGTLLVAHADQGDRDFLAAALVAWGFSVSTTGERDAVLARYRMGGLQALVVERGIIADDAPGWAAARAADGRNTPLILLARAGDDPAIDGFGHERASAILTPPYQLRSLRSAIRAVTKEYV